MIRLQPMDETDFQAFVACPVPRRAAKWVERGIWSEAKGLDTCRQPYAQRLPKGRNTPGNDFVKVIDSANGTSIGEASYTAEEQGGKLQFWVERIQIEPVISGRGMPPRCFGRSKKPRGDSARTELV